jgi:hypothetical protein
VNKSISDNIDLFIAESDTDKLSNILKSADNANVGYQHSVIVFEINQFIKQKQEEEIQKQEEERQKQYREMQEIKNREKEITDYNNMKENLPLFIELAKVYNARMKNKTYIEKMGTDTKLSQGVMSNASNPKDNYFENNGLTDYIEAVKNFKDSDQYDELFTTWSKYKNMEFYKNECTFFLENFLLNTSINKEKIRLRYNNRGDYGEQVSDFTKYIYNGETFYLLDSAYEMMRDQVIQILGQELKYIRELQKIMRIDNINKTEIISPESTNIEKIIISINNMIKLYTKKKDIAHKDIIQYIIKQLQDFINKDIDRFKDNEAGLEKRYNSVLGDLCKYEKNVSINKNKDTLFFKELKAKGPLPFTVLIVNNMPIIPFTELGEKNKIEEENKKNEKINEENEKYKESLKKNIWKYEELIHLR